MPHNEIETLKRQFMSELSFKSNVCRETVKKICDGFIRKNLRDAYTEYLCTNYSRFNLRPPLSYDEFVQSLTKNNREALRKIIARGMREAITLVTTIRNNFSDKADLGTPDLVEPPKNENAEKSTKTPIGSGFWAFVSLLLSVLLAALNRDELWQFFEKITGNF